MKATNSNEYEDTKVVKAFNLLKHENIKVRKRKGKYVFILPSGKIDALTKTYNFSFEQLEIGGDIPLAELAKHIDQQASLEANIGLVAEIVRYKLENERIHYDDWYEKIYYQCRLKIEEETLKPTEKQISSYICNHKKYGKKNIDWKLKLSEMEAEYRIINNVFRSALIAKGKLLPTLRNIVQDGIAPTGIEVRGKAKVKI